MRRRWVLPVILVTWLAWWSPATAQPPTSPPVSQPGAPQQTQPLSPGGLRPPDILIVKMALLAEVGVWSPDAEFPPEAAQIAELVRLDDYLDIDSDEDLAEALETVDAEGAAVLAQIRAGGAVPSPEVTAALGLLSDEDWRVLDSEDEYLATPPSVYVDALNDLFSSQGGMPPDGRQPFPQQRLDQVLTNLDLGTILDLEPLEDEGDATAGAPTSTLSSSVAGQPTPSAVAPADESSSVLVLVTVIGVLALVIVALIVAVLTRRKDDAVVTRAQRADTADGLLDVAGTLTRARDAAEVQRIAVTEAVRVVAGDAGGFVSVVDGAAVVTHQTPNALLIPERIGEGVVSRVIDTGQPIATVSQTEPSVSQLPVSLLAAPIIGGGAVRGVLVVLRNGVGAFELADQEALTKLAPVVAAALDTFVRLETAQADALVDPLTQLGNRRSLDRALGGATASAKVGDHPVSVLMIDVDHFKHYNDTHGHAAGDEALRAVAGAITHAVRDGDNAFRFGGEEFCVVLPGATEADAVVVGERVRDAVASLDIDGAAEQPGGALTVSIGAASAIGDQADAVQASADDALYAAKASGRNRVVSASSLSAD
ncbi:MAG: diguanylate cyclase [Acidimicrobiales bacterium]|nr:diguanylate cyclase [Acidimicrobiales bacterium]